MAKDDVKSSRSGEKRVKSMSSIEELLEKFAALSPAERKRQIEAAGRKLQRIAKLEKDKLK